MIILLSIFLVFVTLAIAKREAFYLMLMILFMGLSFIVSTAIDALAIPKHWEKTGTWELVAFYDNCYLGEHNSLYAFNWQEQKSKNPAIFPATVKEDGNHVVWIKDQGDKPQLIEFTQVHDNPNYWWFVIPIPSSPTGYEFDIPHGIMKYQKIGQ